MSKPPDLFPAAYFVAYPSACSAGTKTKVGEREITIIKKLRTI